MLVGIRIMDQQEGKQKPSPYCIGNDHERRLLPQPNCSRHRPCPWPGLFIIERVKQPASPDLRHTSQRGYAHQAPWRLLQVTTVKLHFS